ncbi:MAG: alpha/beta hydrolase [Saonia sp.]
MKKILLTTADGYTITAHKFNTENTNGKTFVISGGVGLPQRFFFNFAQWLATKGCISYTFDYRGIALSKPKTLKGMKASYRDWTTKDFTAVTEHAKKSDPKNHLFHIGHSFGGNSLGMAVAYRQYDRFLMVGSQYGYYKYFPFRMQLGINLGFRILAPVLTTLLGYFPSKWIGLGEPLPSRVALDWGIVLLHRESLLALADHYGENHYQKITQPILAISIDDDTFAPKKSVDILATKVFSNAKLKRLHVVPEAYDLEHIGHNDFFRKKHKEQLWPIVADWFKI